MASCIGRTLYEGHWYPCTLNEAHLGRCRTWVEEADLENEPRLWSEPDELEARWPK